MEPTSSSNSDSANLPHMEQSEMASSSNNPAIELPNLDAIGLPGAAAEVAAQLKSIKICPQKKISLKEAYAEIVRDPERLDAAANYMYDSLVDDATMGIFLEIHRLWKTGRLGTVAGASAGDTNPLFRIVDEPNVDIFGSSTSRKPVDCICPNCDRTVVAARFAPHLEKCMGMGRVSSRIASRRIANKEGTSTSSSSSSSNQQTAVGTDDEDDVDWSSEKRRKKASQNTKNNGNKKNNGK